MSIGLGNAAHAPVGPSNAALRNADGRDGRRGPEPEPKGSGFQAALRSVEERPVPTAAASDETSRPDSAAAQTPAGPDADLSSWIGSLAAPAPALAPAVPVPVDRGSAGQAAMLPTTQGHAVQQGPAQPVPVAKAGPAAPGHSMPVGWPAPIGLALQPGPGAVPMEFASAQAARVGSAQPPGWRADWPQGGALVAPGPGVPGDVVELHDAAATTVQGRGLPVDGENPDAWAREGRGVDRQAATASSDAADRPVPHGTGFWSWGREAALLAGSTLAMQAGVRGAVGRSTNGAIRVDAQSPGARVGSVGQFPVAAAGSVRGDTQGSGRLNAGSPLEGLMAGSAPATSADVAEPFASSLSHERALAQSGSANPAAAVWQGEVAPGSTRQGPIGPPGFEHTPVAATEALAEQISFHVFQGAHRAEITLQGVGAAAVELRIELRGNQTSVEFRTDNPQARELLENTASDLKDMLERQGLVLSAVSVGSSGDGYHGPGQPRDFRRRAAPMEPVTTPALAPQAPAQRASGLVDLYV